jgi:septal ring factor EnvC (AmiA/AmiB activator)
MKRIFLLVLISHFILLSLATEDIPSLERAIKQDSACKKINQELVSLSKQNRQLEKDLEKNEKKLNELDQVRRLKTTELKKRHQHMQDLITAIGRVSRHGPDSLLQDSISPDTLIRGVILMRSLMKWAHQTNLTLQAELGEVSLVRQKIDQEKIKLESTHLALQQQSKKMMRLLNRRRTLLKKELDQRRKIAEKVRKMAEKAKNINDLVGKIAQREQKQGLPSTLIAPDLSGKYEILPVQGSILYGFGQECSDNLEGLGVVFKTRPNAWVLAPIAGQIVFAGPFRNYQNMIILRHIQKSYYTILAGLQDLSVDVGQVVEAGEPLGTMHTQNTSKLYLELRKNDQTLNPMQWIQND